MHVLAKCRKLVVFARGDHQGARAQAERALAICPNLAAAHGALGVILAYSGRPKEGKEQYDRTVAYIRQLQAKSTTWSVELYNCNAFVADIANFMGLKVRPQAGFIRKSS